MREKSPEEKQQEFNEVMEQIKASNTKAGEWFAEQAEENRQKILSVCFAQGDLRVSIKLEEDGAYTEQVVVENVGYKEGLAGHLPDENQTKSIVVLNEDGEDITINVKREAEQYYLIVNSTETEITISEGGVITKNSPFTEQLDQAFQKYRKENNLSQAIADKDFGLINQIIKKGFTPDDMQVIQLMGLSTVTREGTVDKTPTFLHKLLDPVHGIADSKHVLPLLRRAKALLPPFQYQALIALSDGVTSATQLFQGNLRALLPSGQLSVQSEIDTHNTSIHASVDMSAANLYERFQQRYPEQVITSTSTEKDKVTFARSAEFSNFINGKVEELEAKILSLTLMSDEDLKRKMREAKITKSIEDFRFELGAAQRLVHDCLSDSGRMRGGHFTVDFNETATNGLTLKETLAMVYDALSDDEKLVFTGGGTDMEHDRTSHFTKLINHLYEVKREYNLGSKEGADLNKCPGGAMNHIIYSLQGMYDPNIVDIAFVTGDDVKRTVIEQTSKFLLRYLRESSPAEQELLQTALTKSKLGIHLADTISPAMMERLKADIIDEVKKQYGKYFRNNDYLAKIATTISEAQLTNELTGELGEVNYSRIFSVDELSTAIRNKKFPLYTKTATGYQPSLAILQEREPEYCAQLIKKIADDKQHHLLIEYLVPTEMIIASLEQATDRKKLLDYVIETGDTAMAKSLIEKMNPEDLLIKDKNDLTALHFAARANNTEIAKLLIARMTPEDLAIKRRIDGKTALYYVVLVGRTEIAKLLIARMNPEDLAIKDLYGSTALHFTVRTGRRTEIAKLLIARMNPEDLAIENKDGLTALHLAIDTGNTEIANALIAKMKQEDLLMKDKDGLTALHFAARAGSTEIVNSLIAKMNPKDLMIKDTYNYTALHIALINNHTDIANALIEKMKPDDLAIKSTNGRTALYLAVRAGNAEIVNSLIAQMNPEDLAIKDREGETALYPAVHAGNAEIVNALIEKMKPEDLAIKYEPGRTALHIALINNHTDIANALIEKMKPEDLAINKDGLTALHFAVRTGRIEIANTLIEKMKQEDLAIKNKDGTVLHLALFNDSTDIVNALIKKMKPEDLAIKNIDGDTALHLAIDDADVASVLIAKMKQEDLAIKDKNGRTALHIAIRAGDTDTVKSLIAKMNPKDLMIKDTDDKTAFDYADASTKRILTLAVSALPSTASSSTEIAQGANNSHIHRVLTQALAEQDTTVVSPSSLQMCRSGKKRSASL